MKLLLPLLLLFNFSFLIGTEHHSCYITQNHFTFQKNDPIFCFPEQDFSRHYLWRDDSWQKEEILMMLMMGSGAVTSFFFDQQLRNYTQNKIYSGSNVMSNVLYQVGDQKSVYRAVLILYSWNTIKQDSYLHETLFLSLESLVITQFITELAKKTAKRARPRHSPDDPFNFGKKGASFFSGHSSGVWAYLTVIGSRYEEYQWVLSSFAGGVSLSRVYEDAHWTSDVLFGALVGYAVGRYTAKSNFRYADRLNIIPYLNLDEEWVLVQYRF